MNHNYELCQRTKVFFENSLLKNGKLEFGSQRVWYRFKLTFLMMMMKNLKFQNPTAWAPRVE